MFLPRSVKHYLRPIIIVIVIAILAFQTGCETSSAKPSRDNGRPRQANSSDFFSPPQLSAAAFAFRHWEEHSRTEALPYQVDSYDRRLPPRFRQRLQAMLPELSVIDGEPAWTFAFNRIVFPEDNWAYVVYRESNPYHAIEYADVLRWVDEQWGADGSLGDRGRPHGHGNDRLPMVSLSGDAPQPLGQAGTGAIN